MALSHADAKSWALQSHDLSGPSLMFGCSFARRAYRSSGIRGIFHMDVDAVTCHRFFIAVAVLVDVQIQLEVRVANITLTSGIIVQIGEPDR